MEVLGTRKITPEKKYPGICINLMMHINFEGRVLKEAILETLQHRGTPYERNSMEQIRALDQNELLQNLWGNYNHGQILEKPDFFPVLVKDDRFIGPVYGNVMRNMYHYGKIQNYRYM